MRPGAGAVPAAALCALALTLSACSSTGTGPRDAFAAPEQLTPVENSTVASSTLPPIGQNGAVVYGDPSQQQIYTGSTTPNPNLTGTPQTTGPLTPNPNLTGTPATTGPLATQTATSDGSFVTLDALGSVPDTPGRDLTGGLSVEKLLGGWTVISGGTQCRLNLTQTAKSGTQRYRASTPGCALPALSAVSSWQLAGSQVQLFDENNVMVAALILSGSRFIGTVSGGQSISMVG
jgi:hypothetical protein